MENNVGAVLTPGDAGLQSKNELVVLGWYLSLYSSTIMERLAECCYNSINSNFIRNTLTLIQKHTCEDLSFARYVCLPENGSLISCSDLNYSSSEDAVRGRGKRLGNLLADMGNMFKREMILNYYRYNFRKNHISFPLRPPFRLVLNEGNYSLNPLNLERLLEEREEYLCSFRVLTKT